MSETPEIQNMDTLPQKEGQIGENQIMEEMAEEEQIKERIIKA